MARGGSGAGRFRRAKGLGPVGMGVRSITGVGELGLEELGRLGLTESGPPR
jgi:hypothetical protein